MARRQLQRLTLYARRHYWLIFIGTAIALVLSIGAARRLTFDTDILNLLPTDAPQVRTLRRALKEYGSVDLLVIVVRVPDRAVLDPYEAFTKDLGERLENSELLTKVDFRLGNIEEVVQTLMPQALLFLDEDGRREVEERLSTEAIQQRVRELRRLVATPQALAAKELIRLDPVGLSGIFLDQFASSKEGLAIDWSSGYLLSQDHRMMLILAKPVEPPQNVNFSKSLIAEVKSAIESSSDQWEAMSLGSSEPAPKVDLAGRYVIAIGDDKLIRRDAYVNGLISMFGVLVLFLLAFRRLGLLGYAFVPLTCGLIMTFGFAGLTYGSLSASTSGVAALLIGLGIDFVIVSYGRYVEERQKGASLEAALSEMGGSSGRAVLVGAITSAATFYAFAVTDFAGLLQLGLLTGTGILFCMVSVILLLPAMLAWSDDHQRKRQRERKLFLHAFGSSHLIKFSVQRPKVVLGIGVVLTLIAGFLALELEFKDSVQAMRPKGSEEAGIRDDVAQRFGLGFEQMLLLIRGESLSDVLELAERAGERAAALVSEGVLTGYDGVTAVIPPTEKQKTNLEWLRSNRQQRLDTERVRDVFSAEAAIEGLRVGPFEPGLDLLSTALSRDTLIEPAEFRKSRQTEVLLDRYLRHDGNEWEAVIYLSPPAMIWRREPPPQVVQLANDLGPSVELTGANVISRFLRDRVLRDAVVAAVLGLFLVGIILWLDFRSLTVTILSLAPLVMGVVWMLGGMAALGDSMNFMNVFVTTMIIGIGVDYGIHMIHRYREVSQGSMEDLTSGLVETGKAIVLAALSTIVGFGSLSLSSYPGVQSMGKVAILGAVSTSLVAITVLPAYLSLRRPRSD